MCACVCACATQDDVDHLFAGQLEDHPRILKVNVNSSISFTGLFCIVFSAPSNSTIGLFVSHKWYMGLFCIIYVVYESLTDERKEPYI